MFKRFTLNDIFYGSVTENLITDSQLIILETIMNLEKLFNRIILLKIAMLVIIIAWGASVRLSNSIVVSSSPSTDIGGILFFMFSIGYFITSYFLLKYRYLGHLLFVPMVSAFIILGFLSELLNPSQFSQDIFYLLIFYIVSPAFFIAQGITICLIYLPEIRNKFY